MPVYLNVCITKREVHYNEIRILNTIIDSIKQLKKLRQIQI